MLIHLAAGDCDESDIAPKMFLPPVYLMESMVIATFYQSLLTFIKILHNLTHQVLTRS